MSTSLQEDTSPETVVEKKGMIFTRNITGISYTLNFYMRSYLNGFLCSTSEVSAGLRHPSARQAPDSSEAALC